MASGWWKMPSLPRPSRDQWYRIILMGIFPVGGFAVWATNGHRHNLLIGASIAVLAWTALGVVVVLQDYYDDGVKEAKLKKKLETHDRCPTCAGTGWVPHA